jgi:hypothetical protein
MLAFAFSAASQLFTPAEMALVRTLRRSAPGEAHSVLVGLQYGGQAVAMLGLEPVLYVFGGAEAILALAAAGLAVTACLACVLAFRVGRIAPVEQPLSESFTTSRETLTFFWREWRARYAVVVLAMKAIVLRGLFLAVPIYVTADIGFGQEAVAFLFVPGVLGFAFGLAWAGRTVRLGQAAPTMRMALMGMVIGVLALAVLDYGLTIVAVGSQVPPLVQLEASVNTTFIVALPAAVLLGLSLGAALVAARVALTETAPSTQQSRVFAVQMTLTDSLIVVPLVLMGVGTEFAGARVTLGFLGALAALAVVALELPRWQEKQQPIEREPALASI